MFGGRFSLTKFSLNATVDFDARVDVIFIETITSVVLPTQNTAVESNYRSHIATETILTRGVQMNNTFVENITANINSVRDAPIITRFNEDINSDINVFADSSVELNFDEQIQMQPFTAASEFGFELTLSEQALSTLVGVIDFAFDMNYVESILPNILATSAVSLEYNFVETIENEVNLANNVNAITAFNENINTHIILSYNFKFETHFRGAISSPSNQLSIDTHINHNLRESIFAMTMASELDRDILIVNVTIRPGSTLIIDSENFLVTLDGANIIHLHSGDFINISRDTVDMLITPDGRLTGEIMYLERFL